MLAGSSFDSVFRLQEAETSLYDWDNNIRDGSIKCRFSKRFSEANRLDFGCETKYMNVKFKIDTDLQHDPSSLYDIEGSSLMSSAYLQEYWKPIDKWNIEPGLRLNYYKLMNVKPKSQYVNLSPRLAIRRLIDDSSNLYLALGRYYQYLVLVGSGSDGTMDVWFPIDGSIDPSYADHYIMGYKKEFSNHLALDLELYYKDYKNLAEQDMNLVYSWDNDDGRLSDVIMQGEGFSYGSDILLRTDWRGISSFMGYTFGITRRKMDADNSNTLNGEPQYYYPDYDRAHQLTLMQNFNLAQAFNYFWGIGEPIISFNLSYKTGQPIAYPEKITLMVNMLDFYTVTKMLKDFLIISGSTFLSVAISLIPGVRSNITSKLLTSLPGKVLKIEIIKLSSTKMVICLS